jgi:hypothetical protein
MYRHGAWLMAIVAGLLLASSGECAGARVALRDEVTVPGDSIVLAHLLPSDASLDVRQLAAAIALGKSPQIGSLRHLRGAAVAQAIARGGLQTLEFVIPEDIAVFREDRPLGGEEILASVRAVLGKFSLSPKEQLALLALRPQDLPAAAGLRVPPGRARLEVQDISVDLLSRQARFRIAIASEAHAVPFAVLATLPQEGAPLAIASAAASASPGLPAVPTADAEEKPADQPVLVAAGQSARLWLHSENSSITVDVKALQAGHAGEIIRVRLPLAGTVLRARVTGPRQLAAAF